MKEYDMTLIEYAYNAGRTVVERLSRDEQKSMGQYMTPPAIATYMARRLVATVQGDEVRVLEPAAGAGMLAAATVQELLSLAEPPRRIELLMHELDSRFLPALNELGAQMAAHCIERGVRLDWQVQHGDFLLSDLARQGQCVDNLLVIANPPYFKLNKSDPRAVAHAYAVYGQPNIYGLFMAACARLTAAGGRWCFISPRSWMNGSYFAAVRRTMFAHLRIDSLHVFDSRKEHFEEDVILQEAVITWATGRAEVEPTLQVVITRSNGIGDLATAEVQALPMTRLVGADEDQMVALPAHHDDPFEAWTATLATYGLQVSTGPVVPFRSTQYIRETQAPATVPLLWMQHVGQQGVRWPINKKREHILAESGSAWMLVPNGPMVLMRRFSPKEDERRVTAAAYTGGLPGPVLGLENHLNYIYRPGGVMTPQEACGLAAFLSSRVVDQHFRALAGSTQVNAGELRKLPLPSLPMLVALGASLPPNPTLEQIDTAVERALELPQQRRLQAD